MSRCLAVDLGGTKLSAALIEHGIILKKQCVETLSSSDPAVLSAALSDLLVPMSCEADVVSVASTGIIKDGILTALNPENLGGLNAYPIESIIASITGLKTWVINDAQAAAWAEFNRYEAQYPNMAFITVSTGVGAGLVLNGELQIGARGIFGHAGHMLADPNGPLCGCGRRGCVEALASGRAMGFAGSAYYNQPCTGKEVYSRYLDNQPQAREIVLRSAEVIAQLIANLNITLDLDAVVLGGGVGLAPNYLSLVEEALCCLPLVYRPKLLPALCGTDAGIIGASLWAESNCTLPVTFEIA